MGTDPVEIAAPDGVELAGIGRILAAAFLDDPVWTAVGPRNRRHRAITNRASFWGSVNASVRLGARIRIARLGGAGVGGRLLGATIAFDPGGWPPPDRAFLWELPWSLIAGPMPVARGVRTDRAMRAAHVEHPHHYLWFIGVDPAEHGRGVGGALMADVHAHSEELAIPTYLETGTEKNVAFYESLGYEVTGELDTAGDAHLWLMERPASSPSR